MWELGSRRPPFPWHLWEIGSTRLPFPWFLGSFARQGRRCLGICGSLARQGRRSLGICGSFARQGHRSLGFCGSLAPRGRRSLNGHSRVKQKGETPSHGSRRQRHVQQVQAEARHSGALVRVSHSGVANVIHLRSRPAFPHSALGFRHGLPTQAYVIQTAKGTPPYGGLGEVRKVLFAQPFLESAGQR